MGQPPLWRPPEEIQEIRSPGHTMSVFDFRALRRTVLIVARKMRAVDRLTPFEAIAGCGNSGLPLLGALSTELGIPIVTVRKPGERTVVPASRRCTGAVDCGRYLVVDDCVSSGGTARWVMDQILDESHGRSRPVGVVLYSQPTGADDDPGHQEGEDLWWASQSVRVPIYGMTEADWDELRRHDKGPYAWGL